MVGLSFTRERSKVRSLVRPPDKPFVIGLFDPPPKSNRQYRAERYANTPPRPVENPWNLFTACSVVMRGHEKLIGVMSTPTPIPSSLSEGTCSVYQKLIRQGVRHRT